MSLGESPPLRQAWGWHVGHPARGDLDEATELVLIVTVPDRRARIPRLAHELAAVSRKACMAEAVNRMLRDHTRRAAFGEPRLPPLHGKAQACKDSLRVRWLAAFDGCR